MQINDFDSKFIKKKSKSEMSPAVDINLNEQILKDRETLIKAIKESFDDKNEPPQTTLSYYKFVKKIGKGAFGTVTLGIHKLTGKHVAIKTIEKSLMKDDFSRRKVFQEVYIMKKIKHTNVIRLLEVFESQKHLLMVMEYAGGGDLLHYIKTRGRMEEQDAKYLFKQISFGLGNIHCRSVIHRDIKLDNILLDINEGVKICDFGVSKIVKKDQIVKEQCGTPAYIAPEIIIDKGYQGYHADIWSLGVLLYAMVTGTVPFKAQNMPELHKLIKKAEFDFPEFKNGEQLSDEVKELIRGMIKLEPTARLTIPQILHHPWLKELNSSTEESDEEEEEEAKGEEVKGEVGKQTEQGKANEEKKKDDDDDIDFKSISGNINYVNVDNLFYNENYKTKLSYTNYCCITEDFTTKQLDEEAIKQVISLGFPREFILKSLQDGYINHATTSYYLLCS